MRIEMPVILDEQQEIINWSKTLRAKHISFSTIIEYLTSDKESQSNYISEGLDEVREVYKRYNNSWREQLLIALMIDNYRLQNDIREGQVVSNGDVVGFAFDINNNKRSFDLFNSKDENMENSFIGEYHMDDFKKI